MFGAMVSAAAAVADGAGVGHCVDAAGAGAHGHAELRRHAGRVAERQPRGAAEAGGAPPQRDHRVDRVDHLGGHGPRRQRAEVHARGVRLVDDREPRPRIGGQPDVAVPPPGGADAVVARRQLVQVAHLQHLGGHDVGGGVARDPLGLAQQRADLAAVVAAEVAAHPLADVGGLADVQHLAAVAVEQVDAGSAGQLLGEAQLRRLRVGARCAARRRGRRGRARRARRRARAAGGAARRWPWRRRRPGASAGG